MRADDAHVPGSALAEGAPRAAEMVFRPHGCATLDRVNGTG